MSRLLRAVTSGIAAAAMVVVMAGPGFAQTPANSQGAGTLLVKVTGVRTADGNTFLDLALHGTVTGTFTGSWTETAVEALHPDGTATAFASGTFDVHVVGCGSGTFRFSTEAQAAVNGPLSGRFRSIDEATATVAVHTVDEFHITGPTSFVYSGMYSC